MNHIYYYRILFLSTLLSIVCAAGLHAQDAAPCQPADSVSTEQDYYASMLREALDNDEYGRAYFCYEILDRRDSISNAIFIDCVSCLLHLGKREECIAFCDKWSEKLEGEDIHHVFTLVYAMCYYYMKDYAHAGQYLEKYFADSGLPATADQWHWYGIFAETLYRTGRYEEADCIYASYIENRQGTDNLLLDEEGKELFAGQIYDFAYNSFFMGNEKKGMQLLAVSSQLGNKSAAEDLERLGRCETVMMDLDFRRSLVNKFRRDLDRYDFQLYGQCDSVDFWEKYLASNKDYQSLLCKLSQNRISKTLNKAISEISDGENRMKKSLADCRPFPSGVLEKNLCGNLRIDNFSALRELRVYPASQINAFATPYGQIYLTSGLVLRYHLNDRLLLGVCAHEMAHLLCRHSLVGLWRQYEKEKKNRIAAGILAGLYAATMTGAAVYGASSGATYKQSYYNDIARTSVNIIQLFEDGAYYYQFKYSRGQEIESDLAAYRFCEASGIGGYAYIMALQLLGDNDLYMKSGKTDDHPATAYRIGLLKYLYSIEH